MVRSLPQSKPAAGRRGSGWTALHAVTLAAAGILLLARSRFVHFTALLVFAAVSISDFALRATNAAGLTPSLVRATFSGSHYAGGAARTFVGPAVSRALAATGVLYLLGAAARRLGRSAGSRAVATGLVTLALSCVASCATPRPTWLPRIVAAPFVVSRAVLQRLDTVAPHLCSPGPPRRGECRGELQCRVEPGADYGAARERAPGSHGRRTACAHPPRPRGRGRLFFVATRRATAHRSAARRAERQRPDPAERTRRVAGSRRGRGRPRPGRCTASRRRAAHLEGGVPRCGRVDRARQRTAPRGSPAVPHECMLSPLAGASVLRSSAITNSLVWPRPRCQQRSPGPGRHPRSGPGAPAPP